MAENKCLGRGSKSSKIGYSTAEWLPTSKVVEVSERVEAAFGRDWIEQSRTLPSVVPKGAAPQVTIDRGAYPVLTVVKMGALPPLEGIPGADALIGKLRRGERAAIAEATAIHLLRQHPSDSEVELETPVPIPGRPDKRSDFAFAGTAIPGPTSRSAPPTRPPLNERVVQLSQLAAPIHSMSGSFALEPFFRNMPDNYEIEAILGRVRDLRGRPASIREELPEGLEPSCTTPIATRRT